MGSAHPIWLIPKGTRRATMKTRRRRCGGRVGGVHDPPLCERSGPGEARDMIAVAAALGRRLPRRSTFSRKASRGFFCEDGVDRPPEDPFLPSMCAWFRVFATPVVLTPGRLRGGRDRDRLRLAAVSSRTTMMSSLTCMPVSNGSRGSRSVLGLRRGSHWLAR